QTERRAGQSAAPPSERRRRRDVNQGRKTGAGESPAQGNLVALLQLHRTDGFVFPSACQSDHTPGKPTAPGADRPRTVADFDRGADLWNRTDCSRPVSIETAASTTVCSRPLTLPSPARSSTNHPCAVPPADS